MSRKKITFEEKDETVSLNSYNSEDKEDEQNDEETLIQYELKSQFRATVSAINAFLNKDWIVSKENPDYNIVDRIKGIKYKVPTHKISTFFDYLERCRLAKDRVYFNEAQNPDYSGIMLDFDIYQKNQADQLKEPGILQGLVQSIIELICKIVDFKKSDREIIYVGIIRRPAITMDDTKKCYKDGFHMLIPSVKISRTVKRFIIRKIVESGVLDMAFADVEPADIKTANGSIYSRKDFIDVNSAHVPCFFVGCSSKPGKQPYDIRQIYKVDIKKPDSEKPGINVLNEAFDLKTTNICHEFSLNFQTETNTKIFKTNFEPRMQFAAELMEFERKVVVPEARNIANLHGQISMLRLTDGQAEETQSILNTIDTKYADEYNSWWRILAAIANLSLSYRDLAESFSARSPKYNPADFNKHWQAIVDLTKRKKNHVGVYTLHEYAKMSNVNKLHEEVQSQAFKMMLSAVYLNYNKGRLNHSHLSALLYKLCKYKFATDRPAGQQKLVWYEFITEDDNHSPGEIYKWKCHDGNRPINLMNYISDVLPRLFGKIFDSIKRNLDKAVDEEAKFLRTVLNNFSNTIHKLGDVQEKKRILEDAETRFYRQDFSKNLDQDPFVRGVSNGVLKLSNGKNKPQLIKGYHTLPVSKSMDAPYIPFNPYDPMTKKIMLTTRQIFPNNEGDSHNFIMSYLASTIDGTFKESMFLILVGRGANGKTFLTELHQSTLGLQYMGKLDLSCLTAQRTGPDSATPSTASIEGKTLIRFSEANKNEVLNTAKMKEWTGQETLAARRLHQNIINFRPRCHYLVTTNYDFTVDLQDHGTWRRIIRFNCKIRFVDEENEVRNLDDPFQRPADPTVTTDWCMDPDVRGRYLGYLVWFHYWLYNRYRGKVRNVPHPHIAMETEQFRNEQDTMSAFISRFVVVTEEKTAIPLDTEIPTYMKFLEKQGYKNVSEKGMIEAFSNSELGKRIKNTARGYFIEGCRFLKIGEAPKEGETFLKKQVDELTCDDKNFGIPIETPEEYYERVCREYDQHKDIFDSKGEYYVDVDYLRDEKLAEFEQAKTQTLSNIEKKYAKGAWSVHEQNAPASNFATEETKRTAIRGRLLPAGVEVRPLEEPSFYEKPTIDVDFARSLFADSDEEEGNLDIPLKPQEAKVPPKIEVDPKSYDVKIEGIKAGDKLSIKFNKHKSPGPETPIVEPKEETKTPLVQKPIKSNVIKKKNTKVFSPNIDSFTSPDTTKQNSDQTEEFEMIE